MRLILTASIAAFLVPSLVFAEPAEEKTPGKKKDDRYPDAANVQDAPETAMKKFTVAPGLQIDLWAAEPLLANPVAFAFDQQGRAFVVETYRRRSSAPDIRKQEEWQMFNLSLRSVEERKKFFEKEFSLEVKRPPTKTLADLNGDGTFDYRDLAIESERVKLVVDTDGDGKADKATVYADGFNGVTTGVAAGVAAHGGSVFFTCVPDVWRMDGDKDGVAEKKEALLSGFGIHVVYSGHDMHGPKIGPDGKLYWSIADSGARVETKEGTVLDCPDSGAVFRCDLDGKNAEIVAVGLRNPQSLAFNDLGDLFTGDNNADGGDKARWTHVVEGADYGWRLGWQFLKSPKILGAWNTEGMWHLDVAKTNLHLLPSVGHIGHGPAGIAYYPGTGLPDAYKDHFFYADFPGGVRAFKLTPKGASYTVENPEDILQDNSAKNMTGKLLWGLFPSDVQFGLDGGAYVLDWVQGWEKTGKGRIFRVHDPKVDASEIVQETKRLLSEGIENSSPEELEKYLGHADQRVRQAAQFAAVDLRELGMLTKVANSGEQPLLARLHAIWGLGQLAPTIPQTVPTLTALLQDSQDEVRAQAAKVLGFPGGATASPHLIGRLSDPAPRVRFFAAQSLGRLRHRDAMHPLIALLQDEANEDPFIRHAASVALADCSDVITLTSLTGNLSHGLRTGALLALRRFPSPEVARFLNDESPDLVLEAARAIHDGPIPEAWPKLAALAHKANLPEPLRRRAINTNYLLGTAEAAQRLATVAADTTAEPARRLESIESLATWNLPFERNRITGLWQKLPEKRDAAAAVESAGQLIAPLLKDSDEAIRLATAQMAGSLKVKNAGAALFATVTDANASGALRGAALQALDAIESPQLADAVRAALETQDKSLLEAARKLAPKASPELAVSVNASVLGKGSTREQQEALATIAAQAVPAADTVIAAQLDRLLAGKLPAGLELDLLEAAAQRKAPAVAEKLAAFNANRSATDPLAAWRECLEGGDSKLGREIFAEKAEAGCMRCHKVKGEGGDVGPDLVGFGQKHDRAYILRAIIDPNATIAPGFENVMLTLKDGNVIAGLLNAEDNDQLTLASLADGSKQKVKKGDIKERIAVPSAMPPGLGEVLGKRDLRHVVEYLSKLK